MSQLNSTTGKFTVEASAKVQASASRVYNLIADYRNGHPRILPLKYFQSLVVESGGFGAGTVITFEMKTFGRIQRSRARITEPVPGRVLVETVDDQNIVTSFRVDPGSPSTSVVTISTALPTKHGIAGAIERALVRAYLAKVYSAELALLDRVASAPEATVLAG